MQVVLTVTAGPHQGESFAFREHDSFIVGRGKSAHFRLRKRDLHLSRVHFLIEVNPPCCRLVDAGSRNGSYVNGHRVTATDLADGDEIRGGQTVIRVSIDRATDVDEGAAIVRRQPELQADVPPIDASAPKIADSAPQSTAPWPMPQPSLWATVTSPFVRPPGAPDLHSIPVPPPVTAPRQPVTPPSQGALPSDYEDRIRRRQQPIMGYRIVDELGRGGMGVVYLALREADGSVVALKTVLPASAGTEKDVERFLREARILQELSHPYIVSFRDMGQSHGQLYFVMDFVDGPDAAQILRDHGGQLPVGRAVRFACQLLEALDYAHAKGFIHRDIKPANLLVAREAGREVVRLTDFGLGRTYQASCLSGLTMTGEVGGTVPYMAPEQITRFREAMPGADQYAAAATLYNMLTGCLVYDLPREVGQQLAMILQEDPVPLSARRGDLPAPLVAAIQRALSRDPAARFPHVAAFRQALAPFADRG